ncbi:MAG: hypothetical protein ACI31C_08960 [Muribaculaceae bacterium]
MSNILLRVAVAAMILINAAGCSHRATEDSPAGTAILSLRINLNRPVDSASRAGEYDTYKQPLDDGEKMHTVRVIIVAAAGYVEHNSLWDLTTPDVEVVGGDFPVKTGETKHIILVANEEWVTITDEGVDYPAAEYFKALRASEGAWVDIERLRALTMKRTANDDGNECLTSPLAMSAIHTYYIGTDAERYNATFTIHRAAAKYTFRITNNDDTADHVLNSVAINNVSSSQYFFPNAAFSDADQYFWDSYSTPSDDITEDIVFPTDLTIPAGESVEIGPFYLPESVSGATYKAGFTIDGAFAGWHDINWYKPETPDDLSTMTDLPRNTYVVVNVSININEWSVDYTVCPWWVHNIDIPSYN